MKRTILVGFLAVAMLAGAASLSAHTAMTIEPHEMKNGETKTFSDDGKTITVRREGDTLRVTIEGAGETKKLTITSGDGVIRIDGGRLGLDALRRLDLAPGRAPIVIDGTTGDLLDDLPRFRADRVHTFFVCPKDGTTLRVPEAKDGDTFKCPVDGEAMERRRGRGFSFFFHDGVRKNGV